MQYPKTMILLFVIPINVYKSSTNENVTLIIEYFKGRRSDGLFQSKENIAHDLSLNKLKVSDKSPAI